VRLAEQLSGPGAVPEPAAAQESPGQLHPAAGRPLGAAQLLVHEDRLGEAGLRLVVAALGGGEQPEVVGDREVGERRQGQHLLRIGAQLRLDALGGDGVSQVGCDGGPVGQRHRPVEVEGLGRDGGPVEGRSGVVVTVEVDGGQGQQRIVQGRIDPLPHALEGLNDLVVDAPLLETQAAPLNGEDDLGFRLAGAEGEVATFDQEALGVQESTTDDGPAGPDVEHRPPQGRLAERVRQAVGDVQAPVRLAGVSRLQGGSSPEQVGLDHHRRIINGVDDRQELGGVGEPLGDQAGDMGGNEAGQEYPGQGLGIAEVAGQRQCLVAQRQPAGTVVPEGELQGQCRQQLRPARRVPVADSADGGFEHLDLLGVDDAEGRRQMAS
jgi:hypothetical protein